MKSVDLHVNPAQGVRAHRGAVPALPRVVGNDRLLATKPLVKRLDRYLVTCRGSSRSGKLLGGARLLPAASAHGSPRRCDPTRRAGARVTYGVQEEAGRYKYAAAMGMGRFGFELPMDRERDEQAYLARSERHREARAEREAQEYHHLPIVRQMPTGWTKAADGTWSSTGIDEHLWEVFCAECGDSDGPANEQPPLLQQLRGPYRHEHHAHRVAKRHEEEY